MTKKPTLIILVFFRSGILINHPSCISLHTNFSVETSVWFHQWTHFFFFFFPSHVSTDAHKNIHTNVAFLHSFTPSIPKTKRHLNLVPNLCHQICCFEANSCEGTARHRCHVYCFLGRFSPCFLDISLMSCSPFPLKHSMQSDFG